MHRRASVTFRGGSRKGFYVLVPLSSEFPTCIIFIIRKMLKQPRCIARQGLHFHTRPSWLQELQPCPGLASEGPAPLAEPKSPSARGAGAILGAMPWLSAIGGCHSGKTAAGTDILLFLLSYGAVPCTPFSACLLGGLAPSITASLRNLQSLLPTTALSACRQA